MNWRYALPTELTHLSGGIEPPTLPVGQCSTAELLLAKDGIEPPALPEILLAWNTGRQYPLYRKEKNPLQKQIGYIMAYAIISLSFHHTDCFQPFYRPYQIALVFHNLINIFVSKAAFFCYVVFIMLT